MFRSKPKSLGDILGSFTKTNAVKYQENADKAYALNEENKRLAEESAQADRVTARIKELVV
jgi:hypothetical protein